MANKDYYEILGVAKSATDAEIKSAYRNLAKTYHPDKSTQKSDKEKTDVEAKFKEINQAYSVLSDSSKRSNYDQFGSEDGPTMGGGGGGAGFWNSAGGGFDDIFSNIFSSFGGSGSGGSRQTANSRMDGDDLTYNLILTFKEAAFGVEKEITINRTEECQECKGTGAKNGTAYKTCTKCGGSGTIRFAQNTPFGQIMNTRTCDACRGTGRIVTDTCSKCGGKGFTKAKRSVKVNVPAGVDNGQMMTYYNEGESGRNGGNKGNLIIVLSVKPHDVFKRKGSDLYIEMPITFTQAALGCKIDVPTLTSPISHAIQEGTQTGAVFRLKGKGIKMLKREIYGDLFLTVIVETPKGLTVRQKELLDALNNATNLNQYPQQKAYYESLKKL